MKAIINGITVEGSAEEIMMCLGNLEPLKKQEATSEELIYCKNPLHDHPCSCK